MRLTSLIACKALQVIKAVYYGRRFRSRGDSQKNPPSIRVQETSDAREIAGKELHFRLSRFAIAFTACDVGIAARAVTFLWPKNITTKVAERDGIWVS